MGFEWTREQKAVIETKNRSVLVSAAAGSGKTAVLVERIVHKLTDREHPADIDKLLIVTFTNAAAAEMKERIGREIDRKIEEEPDFHRLRLQKMLLSHAQISTIHSLCLKLIRENFDVLDLDPSFRMGDEAELKLLKSDVAADVMEVYYAAKNTAFRELVERYANGNTDAGIQEMMLQIYTYAQGYPWPDLWMAQCLEQYHCTDRPMSEHPVIVYAVEKLHETTQKNIEKLKEAAGLCLMAHGPEAYYPVIESDTAWMYQLEEAKTYDAIRDILCQLQWRRLPAKKNPDVSEELKEKVKTIRSEVKEDIQNIYKEFFAQTEEMLAKEMAFIRPSVEMLIQLVKSFSQKYKEAKLDRNMLDFSDLEHYALQLLARFERLENGEIQIIPTSIADSLSQYYEEIICDEYQDSNLVQETILSLLSGERFGKYNRFMVGDVKQSIYRFRLADAAIFMGKYDTYEPEADDALQLRIDLHQNFRSRAYVLESINSFFRQLMTKELGGICYDEAAALYPGMVYPDAEDHRIADRTEVLLVDANEELMENEEILMSQVELEARAVAVKIHELTDPVTGVDVYDSQSGCYRRAGYSDIVVLLRTVTGWADQFIKIFSMENIPSTAEMSEGFFDTMEIRTMTEILSVIDNPGQDIPLAAVLKSPVAGLDSEELALIRSGCREGNLYHACIAWPEGMPGYEKLQTFLRKLEQMRKASEYLEIYELLQYIYDITGYYEYVQALPGGQRRKANLDLLVERAVSYASGSLNGLFNFVRYIEQLKKNEIDFGEASVPEDGKGRIRIVSIHKSKGLEYPIVILAGMGKQMNLQDARKSLVIHPVYGIGLDAVNLKNRKKKPSVYKRFISEQVIRDTLAEELRILYVAMTRAKEKLIMTGTVSSLEARQEAWGRISGNSEEPLPTYIIAEGRTYLDWIMPCLLRTNDASSLFEVQVTGVEKLLLKEVSHQMDHRYYREELLKLDQTWHQSERSSGQKKLQLDDEWQYSRQDALHIKGKYTVSELKKAGGSADEAEVMFKQSPSLENAVQDEENLPLFMSIHASEEKSQKTEGGAFRGTAYHRVLELLDFASMPEKGNVEWIKKQTEAMLDAGKLSGEQYDRINPYDISRFVFSKLGRRMHKADSLQLLQREAQFVIGVPAHRIDENVSSEDLVLVQGVIDAWFEEDGQIVLVDYKTDFVPEKGGEAILVSRYGRQLDDYQYALEQITGKKVKEKIIYSFFLKKEIDV